jgi:hypothetical protein
MTLAPSTVHAGADTSAFSGAPAWPAAGFVVN